MRTIDLSTILFSLVVVACGYDNRLYDNSPPMAPEASIEEQPEPEVEPIPEQVPEPVPAPAPAPAPVPKDPFLVSMNIDSLDAELGAAAVDGCDTWSETGVTCAKAEGPVKADFAFVITDDECVDEVRHTMTLGYANFGGRQVVLFRKCLTMAAEKHGIGLPEMLTTVVSHEVGHMLGLLGHIAEFCDKPPLGDNLSSTDGEKLCGKSLMNPFADPTFVRLSEQDLLAFAARTTTRSVIGQKSASHHDHDCTYTVPY